MIKPTKWLVRPAKTQIPVWSVFPVWHTCQLSPINRDSPDFGVISWSPDCIWKISRFSRFWNHLPITFFIAKIENKASNFFFFFFLFLRILQFFKVKVGHTSAWNLRISGHFRYFPPVEVDITEASPIEEGFYTTISQFSPTGWVNYAWPHKSKLHTVVRK